MIKKLLREFFLLPCVEQRALLLLSCFLVLSLAVRIFIQRLPEREMPGMDQFLKDSKEVMAALSRSDSLGRMPPDHPAGQAGTRAIHPTATTMEIPPPVAPININGVDSAGLLPLPGIGPVFAGRIIGYRNLLGGYYTTEQLQEVYGLNQETVLHLGSGVYADTADIVQMKVNKAGFRDLLRHPYLEYEDVKSLVRYREMEGGIGSLGEIRDNHLLPDSTVERIRPYLDFDR
jgi:DNA uptake protein ComE-like DNA-binding protein